VGMGILSKLTGAIFGSIKIAVLLSVLIFFEQKIEVVPKEIIKNSALKNPIENILIVMIPKITEHQGLIKDIEKKANKAANKIKKEL